MSSTARLFYALLPDEATRKALTQLQAPLKGKWTPSENLHITMAFLGNQPKELLPDLCEILARLPAQPIELTLDHLGYFGGSKVAWIGMKQVPIELLEFHKALTEALVKRRIRFEGGGKFTPHITIARNVLELEPYPVTPIKWRAQQFALIQSESPGRHVPQHSIYTSLADRSLDAY